VNVERRCPSTTYFEEIGLTRRCSEPGTARPFLGGPAPFANRVLGADGNLHGTTSTEGTDNAGTVFKISPAGILATIYNFCILSNCADGLTPDGALVKTSDGNFYGTTTRGGVYGLGSIFQNYSWGYVDDALQSLCSGIPSKCPDGSFVYAGLLQSTNGNFYGVANSVAILPAISVTAAEQPSLYP
jgi:uncharacterized repeat protein (TIGR03803 family)